MPLADTFHYDLAPVQPAYNPNAALKGVAKFPASKTLHKGTLVGELVASPGVYDAYDHTASDGLQVGKGILMYDITTDANALITNLGGSIPDLQLSAPFYRTGFFDCADVYNSTELDDFIAAGYGKIKEGSATTGIFEIL